MYQQHFGLQHIPFAKNTPSLWPHEGLANLQQQFDYLLHHPGIGVLTGEPGVGKTAAIRQFTQTLNPHQYLVLYVAETHFSSFDVYSQIAFQFGLVPPHRCAQLWRDIKLHIRDRVENKHSLPILIIDEAQNLPLDFFLSFPSFLNFSFDSKNMMTVWFLGHPFLSSIINRVAYAPFASRIHVKCHLKPLDDPQLFSQLIEHAFKEAGSQSTLLSTSAIELIRTASQGRLRTVHHILVASMQLAFQKSFHHLPDEIVQQAISLMKN